MQADQVTDADGGQYHIGCKPGDLAEYILLVGDPERADKVAKRFDSVRFEGRHREYVTFTGKLKDLDLTVLATGIGQDNTEIAFIEACRITKAPTFIRCGSCSTLQPEPNLGDLIVSTGAVCLEGTTKYFVEPGFPAVADTEIQLALSLACRARNLKSYRGLTASTSGFYGAQGRAIEGFPIRYPRLAEDLRERNVLNMEMETSTLFVLATLRGVRAGAICTVYGNRPKNQFADGPARAKGESDCIDASLDAFRFLDKMDRQKKSKGDSTWLPELSL